MALKFAALKDSGCEGISPSGTTELAVGKEELFTCSHVLGAVGPYTNEASIEGNEGTGTKTSNKVTATVNAEPSFTINKEQKIAGEASYTAGEVTGKLNQTVEYKITVKNTGNVALKFAALKDANCSGITPSGATELAVGKEESFTCSHTLAVGTYTNEASIEGNEGTGTQTSNKVTAKVPAEPNFIIEKQQRIAGEGTYTSAEHTGKLGQVVEYKIIVRNTGNVALKFAAIKDTGCEGLSPTGATELARRRRRVLHLHAHARRGRQLRQRSLDRRQRRHRHQDLQQSHDQSRRRTVLRDRKAAAGQRRRHLRHQRSLRQTRPDRRIQGDRQEHRQRGAQIRGPDGHRLRRPLPLRHDRTRRRQRRDLHLHPHPVGGRLLQQRSLDRRQRRHRQKDLQQSHRQSCLRTVLHDRKAAAGQRRRHLRHRRSVRQTRPDRRIQGQRQEHGQRHAQIQRPDGHRLHRHHAVRHDRTESRRRRDLHLHPLALGGRQLRQRSLHRRQRRHGQKDVQQSHRQSRRRTFLHHREAAADRRRRHLHLRRTHRQSRPGRRIQDHRPQHRQRGAQIRRHERHRLHGSRPDRHDRSRRRRGRVLHLHPHAFSASAPTSTKPRSKATKAPAPRPPTKPRPKSRPNRPSRSPRNRRSKAKPTTAAPKRPANRARRSNTRSSSRTPATWPSNSPPSKTPAAKASPRPARPNWPPAPKRASPAPTNSLRSAPTSTKPRSKATKAPAPRPPTKSPPKSTPNLPTRSKSSSGSTAKAASAPPKSPAKSARPSNTR